MAFTSNNVEVKGVSSSNASTPLPHSIENIPFYGVELTDKEIEFLLVTIKNSLFKGEYVEILYNLTLKLQEKYNEIKLQ
jgi:hypothetical protein